MLGIENDLIVCDSKIFIPPTFVKEFCEMSHASHAAVSRTISAAKQRFYWPKMTADLKEFVKHCKACAQYQASQPREPLIHTRAMYPMEQLSMDLFEITGRHFVLIVDRYSNYTFVGELKQLSTQYITKFLNII